MQESNPLFRLRRPKAEIHQMGQTWGPVAQPPTHCELLPATIYYIIHYLFFIWSFLSHCTIILLRRTLANRKETRKAEALLISGLSVRVLSPLPLFYTKSGRCQGRKRKFCDAEGNLRGIYPNLNYPATIDRLVRAYQVEGFVSTHQGEVHNHLQYRGRHTLLDIAHCISHRPLVGLEVVSLATQ